MPPVFIDICVPWQDNWSAALTIDKATLCAMKRRHAYYLLFDVYDALPGPSLRASAAADSEPGQPHGAHQNTRAHTHTDGNCPTHGSIVREKTFGCFMRKDVLCVRILGS